jgi:hypothetical protein
VLTEQLIKNVAVSTPAGYQARVRWLALVYFSLNAASLAIIGIVVWRAKHLVTLAQRSNVETLTLAIVLVLALNYLLTTFRGFVGAIRVALHNLPHAWNADPMAIERRKQSAIRDKRESKIAYVDQAVGSDESGRDIEWPCADEAGRLGRLSIRGVEMRYESEKAGLNNTFFEFVVRLIEERLQKRDPAQSLQIVFWHAIHEDAASAYHSNVRAFRNLEAQLGKGPLWPLVTLTAADVAQIGEEIRAVVPAMRNEAFLPDVEYEAEYSVPVLPEPLAFIQLRRTETRADPLASMGCATLVMILVLVILVSVIFFPPWVPSK